MSAKSHLLQMRGLKHDKSTISARYYHVASFTDAWIETLLFVQQWRAFGSHLLQMRGLKHI